MTLTIDPIDVGSSVPDKRNLDELTTIALDGTGAFDVLMQAVKLHLNEEYDSNRIVGKEYAEVYLGVMTSVMQQAVAYLLNNSEIDRLTAAIGLLRQQTVTELAKTSDVIPTGLAFNSTTTIAGQIELEKLLVTAQTTQVTTGTTDQHDKVTSDISVNDKQITKLTADIADQARKLDSEISMTDQEILKTDHEILKLDADIVDQARKLDSDIAVNSAQMNKMLTDSADQARKFDSDIAVNSAQMDKMLTDSADQHDKIDSDIAVNSAQMAKMLTDSADQHDKIVSDIEVNSAQMDKMDGEILLLGQKTITELAQTDKVIPNKTAPVGNTNPWLNTNSTVEGAIKNQNDLYIAQKDGFTRDAEQKLAKIMVDSWAVRMGAGKDPGAYEAGLGDEHIDNVLNVVKQGVNVPPIV